MRNFESMAALAAHLAGATGLMRAVEHSALEHCARLVEEAAKEEIGTYQTAIGPFDAWAPLADSTEAAKASAGYPADAPLLATGALRNSIGHEVEGSTAIIGSTDEKMIYHELGTSKMPPRPVMVPALLRNKEKILEILGEATFEGIVAGQIVGSERLKL
ncbi:HK97-gp10 family putative phage morphogenesis protein [Variovorax sp. LG9.2]|uniref:HK97-gp10 family putative phage morphogenesis protein n=1 Tax=Variovorax sp. LG9.2 TaxID=3048626 RepID=UPI002B239FE8|nr:HK97-gp10 family putative phage morphogenesis protein [Variovorax sp. LG9.2]MEB0059239.1 hypothetical protein [Variovorax sp. LG9.2]